MRQFAIPQPHQSKAVPFCVKRLVGLIVSVGFVLLGIFGGASPALAQLAPSVGVEQLITTTQLATPVPPPPSFPDTPYTTPCDPGSFAGCNTAGAVTNLTFGAGNNIVLDAVTVAGNRFEPATDLLPPLGLVPRLVFRRSGPIERALVFLEQLIATPDTLTLAPGSVATLEEAMLSNVINRGIDNVFNNVSTVAAGGTGQETANNIERIDYIIDGGINVPPAQQGDVGFLILERGGNDAFKIAAITGLDGAGLPSAYGPLIDVVPGDWGNANDVSILTAVLRRDDLGDPTPPLFRPSHTVPAQLVQGIFFPINSLVEAPDNANPVFGYSLFAADVTGAGAQLVDFTNTTFFPATTNGSTQGGLDLIAGGFGLIRQTTIAPTGSLSLLKRITNLFGPANLPNFNQFVGDGATLALLQNNNLGQGLDVVTDPQVQAGNGIEYTVYLANSSTGTAANAVVCDQIPQGLTFDPNAFGPGIGIQAIAASSPPGPVVNYTNAADGDPGTFFAPGAALPPFCGTNQGNGAVVVNAGDVAADQVGLIRFRTTVNQ